VKTPLRTTGNSGARARRAASRLLALGLLCCRTAAAEQWQIRPADSTGERLSVTVTPAAPERRDTPAGIVVSFPGPSADRAPGSPDLGSLVLTLPGRAGFRAVVRILEAAFEELADMEVAPAEGFRRVYADDNAYRIERVRQADPAVYGADSLWPPALLTVDEACLGTNRYVRLVCWPAQYNPARRRLRLHSRIVAELAFVPDDAP